MRFRSRDRWPFWLWLFLIFLAGSLSLAIDAALGSQWAWISLIAQLTLLIWSALSTPLQISVDENWLYIGDASIERRFISSVTALTSPQMALLRGRDANPQCWMALRFWVSPGVKIEINDPADPTPYWLVSTKKATALAAALS